MGRDEDHLYREEMDQWPLDAKHVVYSREQKHKVYVQDLMRKKNNAEALASAIIDGKGSVYVCGGTSMGTAVMEAVIDALEARRKIGRRRRSSCSKCMTEECTSRSSGPRTSPMSRWRRAVYVPGARP